MMRQLSLPQLGLLRRYLITSGWRVISSRDGLLELFIQDYEDEKIRPEIILPKKTSAPDVGARIALALRTLSDLDDVAVDVIVQHISMLDYDVLRAVLPDEVVEREGIKLNLAERFIGDLRRLFVSSATAQITGEAFFRNASAQGYDFVRRCRLGHTFAGSFGFTIEAPVGPNSTFVTNVIAPTPVERRITERLMFGLRSIQFAEEDGDGEVLYDNLQRGFNVNMLEDISSMLQRTEAPKITFSMRFSEAWTTEISSGEPAVISTKALSLIDEVVRTVRHLKPRGPERVFGTIFRLQSHDAPPDMLETATNGEIAIDVKSGERSGMTLRAKIAPDQYIRALDAHEHGRLVTLVGRVEQTRRGYVLQDVSEFNVVAFS